MILILDTMSTGVATTSTLHHTSARFVSVTGNLELSLDIHLVFFSFPRQPTQHTHSTKLQCQIIMSAQARRHCKNLFSEDCYSYSDDNFTTLSPPSSSPSSSSPVTVSSISTVWNMTLIISSSVTVSIISLYSVIIIHRNDTVHSYF